MKSKLNLSLNNEALEKAKQYAKRHNLSLSALVENYFNRLGQEFEESETRPSLVEAMSGIIHLDNDFDYKKDFNKYICQKHKS